MFILFVSVFFFISIILLVKSIREKWQKPLLFRMLSIIFLLISIGFALLQYSSNFHYMYYAVLVIIVLLFNIIFGIVIAPILLNVKNKKAFHSLFIWATIIVLFALYFSYFHRKYDLFIILSQIGIYCGLFFQYSKLIKY